MDTKRCLSLTGDGKSFPRRLSLWGEQKKISTKQDTIFPHSHAQPGNSGETEYLSLVQQLWVVQMGWRREETICLIINRRFMLLLRAALTVASFCSKAPLTYIRPSQWAERPSLTLLPSTRLPLLCPCSYEWSGSSPQASQHGSLAQPLTVTPGEGCVPAQSHKSPLMLPNATRPHWSCEQPEPVHTQPIPPRWEILMPRAVVQYSLTAASTTC